MHGEFYLIVMSYFYMFKDLISRKIDDKVFGLVEPRVFFGFYFLNSWNLFFSKIKLYELFIGMFLVFVERFLPFNSQKKKWELYYPVLW